MPLVFCQHFFIFFLSFCLHPTVSDKSASDERRRRDLNPRAAVNDLHPFQGCPFGQLGYFSSRIFFIFIFLNIHLKKMNGESGIRTHAPLRTNGFQDRLVMTTSISLQQHFLNQGNCVCSCHDALSHHRFSNQRKNDSIISWTSCQYNFFIFFQILIKNTLSRTFLQFSYLPAL